MKLFPLSNVGQPVSNNFESKRSSHICWKYPSLAPIYRPLDEADIVCIGRTVLVNDNVLAPVFNPLGIELHIFGCPFSKPHMANQMNSMASASGRVDLGPFQNLSLEEVSSVSSFSRYKPELCCMDNKASRFRNWEPMLSSHPVKQFGFSIRSHFPRS